MNHFSSIFHIALADWRERTRCYSFLVMLGLVVYLGFLVNNGQIILRLGNYRGEFSSAWIGAMMALVVNFFLSLFGFYLVNNSIQRDHQTGVGQIIAATPVRRVTYLLGKWMSNIAVLSVMVLILAGAAVMMQVFQSETGAPDLWALLAPFLIVCLPMIVLIAAAAVLFEALSVGRGGWGNVLYFIVWMGMVMLAFNLAKGTATPHHPMGFGVFANSMISTVRAVDPDYGEGFSIAIAPENAYKVFSWHGIEWTSGVVLGQLQWIAVGMGLVLISALGFTRFDPVREQKLNSRKERRREKKLVRTKPTFMRRAGEMFDSVWRKARIPARIASVRFLGMVQAELNLMLKGNRWWWWLMVLVLNMVALTSPLEAARQTVLPLCWMAPLLVWSAMGSREQRFNTRQMVFSAPKAASRLLLASMIAGMIVTGLTGAGAGIRFLAECEFHALVDWLVAVGFIPMLALAFGIWSGSSKLFEVVYVIWWYLGPINGAPRLDFLGARGLSNGWLVYLGLAVLLAAAAYAGRWRQVEQAR